jgi:hypothetical protein
LENRGEILAHFHAKSTRHQNKSSRAKIFSLSAQSFARGSGRRWSQTG